MTECLGGEKDLIGIVTVILVETVAAVGQEPQAKVVGLAAKAKLAKGGENFRPKTFHTNGVVACIQPFLRCVLVGRKQRQGKGWVLGEARFGFRGGAVNQVIKHIHHGTNANVFGNIQGRVCAPC